MIEIIEKKLGPTLTDELWILISGFILNSGEPELTAERVFGMMNHVAPDEYVFFEIRDDKALKGYLFAQTMPDEYGDLILLVQSAYIHGVTENFWPDMVKRLEDFGRSRGCDTMYFTTRRNPKAFMRLLRTPWTLDSHVMKHEFKKESNGQKSIR